MVNLWDNESSAPVAPVTLQPFGAGDVTQQPAVENISFSNPDERAFAAEKEKIINAISISSGGAVTPQDLDGLSENELSQINPNTIGDVIRRAAIGEAVDTAGLPTAVAHVVERTQQAVKEREALQENLGSMLTVGAIGGTMFGAAPAALSSAGAGEALFPVSSRSASPEPTSTSKHPFEALLESLKPIIALFQQLNMTAQNAGQGVEVGLNQLGNLAPPPVPTIGRSQELGQRAM
ncbi:MAG: hypothetical protein EAZ74_05390 [Alphaproteobacteria bacterium]|nr:MAG: hypothetical protein EAY76_05165 [Alphaproteobacteria bacterium]TAF13564.1 MAG: hypothetical protein EAZ74_05390 [Alphaproteobacteria bacterium]TAF75459.1 MAG: hypothetical protein EAZ52_06420 [Alphaproteobacteria bacterium]